MATYLTLWGAREMLRVQFGQSSPPADTLYVALIRGIAPTAFSAGFELDEPSKKTGYVRADIPNKTDFWEQDSWDSISNAKKIKFQPALTDWGTINYWALCNSEVEGRIFACGDLQESVFVEALDEFVISPGALAITLGPIYTQED